MKRKPSIAVADADPDEQLLLKRAFEECRPDLQILCFDNGSDLLDYLNQSGKHRKRGPAPDLIAIDLLMPDKNGFELTREIKTNPSLKHIPLIVLTDSSSDEDIKRCYELGANTVITRPDPYDELVSILRKTCDYWFGGMRM
jgi:two-component system response regulator